MYVRQGKKEEEERGGVAVMGGSEGGRKEGRSRKMRYVKVWFLGSVEN